MVAPWALLRGKLLVRHYRQAHTSNWNFDAYCAVHLVSEAVQVPLNRLGMATSSAQK